MAWMLNVADVFQLIVNCLNNRSFSEHYSVKKRHKTIFHIRFQSCYDVYALVEKHFKQTLGNISFIAVKFSEQFLFQYFKYSGIAVVSISRRKVKAEDFSFFITDEMELKSIKPTHWAFSALGESIESFVVKNSFVVANADFGAVHKADTRTFSETNDVQKQHHGSKHLMFNGYKAIVWQLVGEFFTQVYTDIKQIKVFEVFKTAKVVKHQNSDDFAIGHFVFTIAAFFAVRIR